MLYLFFILLADTLLNNLDEKFQEITSRGEGILQELKNIIKFFSGLYGWLPKSTLFGSIRKYNLILFSLEGQEFYTFGTEIQRCRSQKSHETKRISYLSNELSELIHIGSSISELTQFLNILI